jgi:hypothetical protein
LSHTSSPFCSAYLEMGSPDPTDLSHPSS